MTRDTFATVTFVRETAAAPATPATQVFGPGAIPRPPPAAPLRILLGAFVCAPGLGSEEGVGWGLAWALAQNHRVHVLTTPRHRAAIELHLAEHPCANLTFSYFDFSPAVVGCAVTSALWQVYYYAWQCRIGTWAQPVAEAFAPDVVQHVTYGRYWMPTTLWKLGRPFLWGPVGGGDACPPAFLPALPWRERWSEAVRGWAQRLAHHDGRLRETAARCDLALASTPETAARLRALGCARVDLVLQMAVDEELLATPAQAPDDPPVFCVAGRMIGWKGQGLALRAFARARIAGAKLVLIGDGPLRETLAATARELAIHDQVIFAGSLSRRQTLEWMRRATALVHPSFHDQAPTVIFEAMAVGTPVIALALGGAALQVTPATGFLIRATSPRQAIADISDALRVLRAGSRLRQGFAQAGRDRIRREFTWREKAARLAGTYQAVLDSSRPR